MTKPDQRAVFFGVFMTLVPLTVSGQARSSASETIRLIELLETQNIRNSPLLSIPGLPILPPLAPATAYPLRELASAQNPLGLKVKLGYQGNMMEALLASPRSEYVFDAVIPPDAVLDFGTGIMRDLHSRRAKTYLGLDPQEVRFIIRLEAEGKERTIFSKTVPVPPKEEVVTLTFAKEKIPLDSAGLPVRLTLLTEGDLGAFSFWFNPVIYTRKARGRGIILISLDALRQDHLGCYGYTRPTSPNIDALAQDGVLFEEAHATSNWTLPSHTSLLSALYGSSHGVYRPDQNISPSLPLLAEVLRNSGFFCQAITGSGFINPFYGFWRGFDSYDQGPGALTKGDSAGRVFEAAADWLGGIADKDFFLFLHTYQVHGPLDPPAPYNEMFVPKNARWSSFSYATELGGKSGSFKTLSESDRENVVGLYDGEVRYTDDVLIGPLIAKLKELRLYDQTMIILLSDHGEEFMERGSWQHGHSLYEGALRVPLIIKLPASRSAGRRVRGLCSLVDAMPTILDELKIKTARLDLDGESLSPLIKGKKRRNYGFLADTSYPSIDFEKTADTPASEPPVPDIVSWVEPEYKLILHRKLSEENAAGYSPPRPSRPDIELYDRKKDPGEKINLAAKRPDVVRRMLRRIQEIYSRPPKGKAGRIRIDGKLEEELRALGYIR